MDHLEDNHNSTSQLIDFDWNLKVLLGTSSIVAYPPPPLVQVGLYLCDNSKNNKESSIVTDSIKLEMNEQELKTFISVLEKAVNSR